MHTETSTDRRARALNDLQDAAHVAEYLRIRHLRSRAHGADLKVSRRGLIDSFRRAVRIGTAEEARRLAMRRGRDAARLELGFGSSSDRVAA
jgi:hypothetical protein